jgi:hypothetical protein
MPKRRPERTLYPLVQRWLKRHFACFRTSINKGLQHSRIDIVGVRDTGGDLSGEVETIAIEVKRGSVPFANACGQTLGYNVYANRVYLADLRPTPFTDTEVHIASHLGIGLIQIKSGKCVEVISSPVYKPMQRLNLRLLEALRLGRVNFVIRCLTSAILTAATTGGRTSPERICERPSRQKRG